MQIFKPYQIADALKDAFAEINRQKAIAQSPINEKLRLRYLIIHCTATPEKRHVSVEDIKKWHLSPVKLGGRGWKQVGYSDIIYLDGTLVNLVPYDTDQEVDPWELTNGVKGINQNSRHIVYAGGTDFKGKPKDTRTTDQLNTLKEYVLSAIQLWPNIQIAGHRQFDSGKACPSFDVPAWLKSLGVPPVNIYKEKKP